MSEGFKICPICDTPARGTAIVCKTCGSALTNVPVVTIDQAARREQERMDYDYRFGETDLYEGNLRAAARTYTTFALTLLASLMTIALALAFGPQVVAQLSNIVPLPPTATLRPTLALVTVTPAPPTNTATATDLPTHTPTATPTPEPCIRTVNPNDTLSSLIFSCGYNSTEGILDIVLEENNITNPGLLQLGQEVVIPWPTPTADPAGAMTPTTEGAQAGPGDDAAVGAVATDPFSLAVLTTPTLPPGIMWHTVQQDETILSIAYIYGANIEILSQLNPQIPFSQCDMGRDNGGPNCTVSLSIGQQVRVPAPTPTPTLSPTPSGSETPTPSPTATFNAPSALSPGNLAHFQRDQWVTLRWVSSATLAPGQIYRVTVRNETTEESFTSDTTDITFIIPTDWQGQGNRRFSYSWFVSTVLIERPTPPLFTTETRTFTWDGR